MLSNNAHSCLAWSMGPVLFAQRRVCCCTEPAGPRHYDADSTSRLRSPAPPRYRSDEPAPLARVTRAGSSRSTRSRGPGGDTCSNASWSSQRPSPCSRWHPSPRLCRFLVGGISFSSVGGRLRPDAHRPHRRRWSSPRHFRGATALDFTTTGSATPGVAGGIRVDSTSGDFNVLARAGTARSGLHVLRPCAGELPRAAHRGLPGHHVARLLVRPDLSSRSNYRTRLSWRSPARGCSTSPASRTRWARSSSPVRQSSQHLQFLSL